ADPANASLFDELRKTWLGIMADQVEQQLDMGKEWESMLPKLSGLHHEKPVRSHPKLKRKTKTKPLKRIPKLPAVVPESEEEPEREVEPKVVHMETASLPLKVILIRASLIAAIALILLIPIWVAYRYFTRTEVIRLTASDEVLDALLPDGSMISLNAYASLTYTEDFGKTNRDIELNGEGFFEVTRDSLLQFLISCGSSRLEVLGTSFYVNAEQVMGNMEVVLVDGSVSVYFENERSTGKSIIPGEKAKLIQADKRI
ncbi:unnamed protein product, partial [marine sediment metagenome]